MLLVSELVKRKHVGVLDLTVVLSGTICIAMRAAIIAVISDTHRILSCFSVFSVISQWCL